MSKGGAGKVYFVLYLAVVLELLIIIVERDEAEEHLHQKQKEAMRIVESILSQLQSGAGTEGINTRPQDEITIPPPGVNIKEVLGADIKSFRQYIVEVGVTDISTERERKEGEALDEYFERLRKLYKLANVAELEYSVFYNSSQDPNYSPPFPSESYLSKKGIVIEKMAEGQNLEGEDGTVWTFKGLRKLEMDNEKGLPKFSPNANLEEFAMGPMHPLYPVDKGISIGPNFAPSQVNPDSVFTYSVSESEKASGTQNSALKNRFTKRAFVVNFQPPSTAGWYKLRFASRTNRILGVKGGANIDDIDENSTVNIGTVQLKIKDLVKVQKELGTKLEKFAVPTSEDLIAKGFKEFDEKLSAATLLASKELEGLELANNIKLYGYIVKLLTPGQSANFEQNKGAIEFNVRVVTPKPQMSEPVINIVNEMHRINSGVVNFNFTVSPYQGNNNIIAGQVYAETDLNTPVANVEIKPRSETPPGNGGIREYIGTITKEIMASSSAQPRTYIVKMKHTLQGKFKEETSRLTLYPALNEDNIATLTRGLDAFAQYGKNWFFDFVPPSGNKIAPEQFCYYFATDQNAGGQGPACKAGYKATNEDKLSLCANVKTASMKIVWKDPVTGKETEVYPYREFKIKQGTPELNVANKQVIVTGDKKLSIQVSNITVGEAILGCPDDKGEAQISATTQPPTVTIPGYTIVVPPQVTVKGKQISFTMELEGKPTKDGIIGNITVPLTIRATNPLNGAVSNPQTKPIIIEVAKAPEKQRRR